MEKNARYFEIRTYDGKPIFTVQVCEKQFNSTSQQREQSRPNGNNASSDPAMTDAQKRYLFRILAEQGYEGDKAHQRLKELLGVDSLQEVSKLDASKLIERLLEEQK